MLDLEFASKAPRTDEKREVAAAMVARDLRLDMVYIEKKGKLLLKERDC